MTLRNIGETDCPPYYRTYLKGLDPDIGLTSLLDNQLQNFPKFLKNLPESKLNFSYAPGKWTLAESLVHVFDTERVFQYRALRFGRKDGTPLPGFDQDQWVPHSKALHRSIEDLVEEYKAIRLSTISLFKQFSTEDFEFKGIASGQEITLSALGFIICGHQRHHREIIRSKYL